MSATLAHHSSSGFPGGGGNRFVVHAVGTIWVPVAGTLIFLLAVLVTWLLGTVGFGAAILSRGGLREGFAGRLLPPEALTDEFLWATPQFGVPAAKRPGSRTPPPLR